MTDLTLTVRLVSIYRRTWSLLNKRNWNSHNKGPTLMDCISPGNEVPFERIYLGYNLVEL